MPSKTTRRLPRSQWEPIRAYILARDNLICYRCQRRCTTHNYRLSSHANVDHVLALSLGGTETEQNLRTICKGCNGTKGALERRVKENRAKHNGNDYFRPTHLDVGSSRATSNP